MTGPQRWWRFNLVGAMGVAVQLGTLALLNRWMPGHYLAASALALEVTLLHNFLWHSRYTWRERSGGGTRLEQLLRFHLTNGLISLAGTLALMRLLVQGAHLPPLAANPIAILCCSLANFLLADRVAFARPLAARTQSSA